MSASLSVISTTLFAQSNILLPFPHLPNNQHICYPLVAQPKPRITTFSTHCFVASETATPTTITTTTTTTTTTNRKMHMSLYLIERLSFSEKEAQTAAEKLLRHREKPRTKQVTDLIYIDKADDVLSFFKGYCQINQSHIIKHIIRKYPRVLVADADNTLKPKIKLLQDLGFSASDLALVLSRNPILYLSCDLSPDIQALRGIMGSDENTVKVFKGLSYGSSTHMNYMFTNVDMLESEYGVPRDKLRKFMTSTPKTLMWRTDWLRGVLARIEDKWGISRDSTVFLTAIFMFGCFSDENIDSKCQVFRSFGWLESDIKSFIRQHPFCLKYSVTKTKKALEFYMNELDFEPAYLAARPSFFSYSLENRVLPRHKVLSILKAKRLIKADYQLYHALILPDDKFIEKFVQRFTNDVPKLREVYING